jgi:hypothetical protein
MPTVDIPGPSNRGIGSGGGLSNVPTPILLIGAGVGAGLIFLLLRNRTATPNGASPDQNVLLPNTAVMLGSLQEQMLNMQGTLTQNQADTTNQFATLNTFLQTQFDALKGNEDNLSAALSGLQGTQTADMTSIGNAFQNVVAGQGQLAGLISQLQALIGQQNSSANQQQTGGGGNVGQGRTISAAGFDATMPGDYHPTTEQSRFTLPVNIHFAKYHTGFFQVRDANTNQDMGTVNFAGNGTYQAQILNLNPGHTYEFKTYLMDGDKGTADSVNIGF